MEIKDYIILGLCGLIAVLVLRMGCRNTPFSINDCPEPKEIIKEVLVKGEVKNKQPISKPKETVQPIPITKPFLVATYVDRGIYINPQDTATIYDDWFIKREYEENLSDSNITATAHVEVQNNRLQGISLNYEYKKTQHTTLYDRFQFHVLGGFGIRSDWERLYRINIGAGALMEFKTGTGLGAKYGYTFGSDSPHGVDVLLTQRLSFRKRNRKAQVMNLQPISVVDLAHEHISEHASAPIFRNDSVPVQ